jgi:hypothetical protein
MTLLPYRKEPENDTRRILTAMPSYLRYEEHHRRW